MKGRVWIEWSSLMIARREAAMISAEARPVPERVEDPREVKGLRVVKDLLAKAQPATARRATAVDPNATAVDLIETVVDPNETVVDLIETAVDLIETADDLNETVVDPNETAVDLNETVVDLNETAVDLNETAVGPNEIVVDLSAIVIAPNEKVVGLRGTVVDRQETVDDPNATVDEPNVVAKAKSGPTEVSPNNLVPKEFKIGLRKLTLGSAPGSWMTLMKSKIPTFTPKCSWKISLTTTAKTNRICRSRHPKLAEIQPLIGPKIRSQDLGVDVGDVEWVSVKKSKSRIWTTPSREPPPKIGPSQETMTIDLVVHLRHQSANPRVNLGRNHHRPGHLKMSRTEADVQVVRSPRVMRDVADEDATNQREAKVAANQVAANQDAASQRVETARPVASPNAARARETSVRPAMKKKMNSVSSTTSMMKLLSHPNLI
jgi:hypothetical protein